jgi:hypothetical protein
MTKTLLEQVPINFPDDIAAQNRSIDSRRNGALNRIVRDFFGDKNDVNPVLNFRHGEEQDNCKALRAAYLALATERDCQGSMGAKMLHAAKLAGHFTNENPNDRDLNHLVTTLGYSDYFVNQTVPFPTMPDREPEKQVRVSKSDFDIIAKLQIDLNSPNQKSVISHLIESYLNRVDIAKELLELQTENAQLKAQITQLQEDSKQMSAPTQQVTLNVSELESWLENKLEALLDKKLGERTIKADTAATVATLEATPVKEEIDLTGLTNAELWGDKKIKGSPVEKVRRSFLAMCLYNDTVATGDNDRIAITNLALSQLSGANRSIIGEWTDKHRDEIISHHSKYGIKMGTVKNPSSIETYYNKGKDVNAILKRISEQFLDGVAIT